MKEMKWFRFVLAGFTGLFLLSGNGVSQDINEAKTMYNIALQTMKGDPAEAIKTLQICIDLCDKIGAPADSVKMVANSKFAETYFNLGYKQASSKDLIAAEATFKTAIEYGEKTNNAEVLKRSNAALGQIYYMQAETTRGQKDLVRAQELISQSLVKDSTSTKALMVQAYIFRDGNMADEFEATLAKINRFAKNGNETKMANQSGLKFFLAAGSKAVNSSNFEDGLIALEKALKYDNANKDLFFYLSKAYNGLKLWDKALEAANKGIELEEDVPEKEAKFWFEVGTAFAGKEDKTNACESFKKAMYGQFVEPAKYEIEVALKCGK